MEGSGRSTTTAAEEVVASADSVVGPFPSGETCSALDGVKEGARTRSVRELETSGEQRRSSWWWCTVDSGDDGPACCRLLKGKEDPKLLLVLARIGENPQLRTGSNDSKQYADSC